MIQHERAVSFDFHTGERDRLEIRLLDPHGKLLVELAREGFFERLARVHLAARELPEPRERRRVRALLEQHAARLREDARRHEQDLPRLRRAGCGGGDRPAAADCETRSRRRRKVPGRKSAAWLREGRAEGPAEEGCGQELRFHHICAKFITGSWLVLFSDKSPIAKAAQQVLLCGCPGDKARKLCRLCESKRLALNCRRRNCASSGHSWRIAALLSYIDRCRRYAH